MAVYRVVEWGMSLHETPLTKKYIILPLRMTFGKRIHVEKVPGTQYNVGLSDLIGALDGLSFWCEVKKWDNKYPTPMQRTKLVDHARAGGLAFLLVIFRDKSMKAYLQTTTGSPGIVKAMTGLYDLLLGALNAEHAGRLEDYRKPTAKAVDT